MRKKIDPSAPRLKVGDKVAYYSSMVPHGEPPTRIMTVLRVTPTLAICEEGKHGFGRFPITHRPANAHEIARVAGVEARKRKDREEAEVKAAIHAADPRLSLADHLQSNADILPWQKLTLEQLQQIDAMFKKVEG